MPLYSTPLGSPTVSSKWSYVHVPVVPWPRGGAVLVDIRAGLRCRVGTRAGITGGYTGWVIRGVPSYPATALSTQPPDSDRRERASPAGGGGLEAGWVRPLRVTRYPGPRYVRPHPFGARSPFPCPWQGAPWCSSSSGLRARFHDISYKVSQNGRVSPKYVQKA